MRIPRTIERLLFAVGACLCLFYVAAIAHREVGSWLALRAFQAAGRAADNPAGESNQAQKPAERPNFSLWAEKRIAAYKDSLALHFDPPVAVLRIKKFDLEVPVFEGTDDLVLNRGVGWILGTARPGQPGNIGIAGHRDGFFRCLKDIAAGDVVTLQYGGSTAEFVVDQITIVTPNDVSVLDPTAKSYLTLATCYPFYFMGDAPQRYIVRCSRVEPLRNINPAGPQPASTTNLHQNQENRR